MAAGVAEVFGRRLRELREAAELTQVQLAAAVDLDPKHIGTLERGEKTPSFDAVERLAKVLKVHYYELFLPDELESLNDAAGRDLRLTIRELERNGSPKLRRFLTRMLAAAKELARP